MSRDPTLESGALDRPKEGSYPYVSFYGFVDDKRAVSLDGKFNADDLRRIIEELERNAHD